jgi:hypothetical protein
MLNHDSAERRRMTSLTLPGSKIDQSSTKPLGEVRQKQKTVRLTVDVTEDFDAVLLALADKKHVSKSEILRKAVVFYAYLARSVTEDRKVSITDMDDKVIKDIVLM